MPWVLTGKPPKQAVFNINRAKTNRTWSGQSASNMRATSKKMSRGQSQKQQAPATMWWFCFVFKMFDAHVSQKADYLHVQSQLIFYILYYEGLHLPLPVHVHVVHPPLYLACGWPAVIIWVIVNEFKTTCNNIEPGADKPKADKEYWKRKTENMLYPRAKGRGYQTL